MGEVFRKAEAAIYLFAGLLVVLGAVYVLGEALVQGVGLFLGGGGSKVAVYAVSLASASLVIGLIAGVRRILVVTAEGLQKFSFSLQDPGFQAVLAELLLLSLMVLTLAWAYRLVRGV